MYTQGDSGTIKDCIITTSTFTTSKPSLLCIKAFLIRLEIKQGEKESYLIRKLNETLEP